jgi:hypothetical protein
MLAREDLLRIGRVVWPTLAATDRASTVRLVKLALRGELSLVTPEEMNRLRALAREAAGRAHPSKRIRVVETQAGTP